MELTFDMPDAVLERAQAIATKVLTPEVTGAVDTASVISSSFSTAPTLTNVQQGFADVAKGAVATANSKVAVLNNMTAINENNAALTLRAGLAKADTARVVAEAEYKSQEATVNAAKIIGADMNDPNSVMNKAGRRFEEKSRALIKIDEEIEARTKVKFLEDPLSHFVNSFKLPGLVQDRTAVAQSVNTASTIISKASAATSDASNVIKATQRSLDANSASRAYNVVADLAMVAASKFGLESLSNQIELVDAMQTGNTQRVAAINAAYQARVSEESRLAAKAQRQLAQAQLLDRNKASQNEAQEKAHMLALMSKGRVALGGTPIPLTEAEFRILDKRVANQWLEAGRELSVTGIVSAGTSPGQAFIALSIAGGTFNNSAFNAAQSTLKAVYLKMPDDIKKASLKNPTIGADWIDSQFKGTVDPKGKVLTFGLQKDFFENPDKQEITRAPPPALLGQQSPELFRTPLFQRLIAPQIAANNALTLTPQQLMSQVMAAISSNELTTNQAVNGIAAYYRAAITSNMGGLAYIGLPPQNSYPVSLEIPGRVFGDTDQVYDLTKTNDIQRYITDIVRKSWSTTAVNAMSGTDALNNQPTIWSKIK